MIQLLLVLFIIGLLLGGPSCGNIWLTRLFYTGIIGFVILAFWYSNRLSSGIANFLFGGSAGKANDALLRAERLEGQNNFRSAVEAYEEAIQKDKKNPAPQLKLANLYFRLREYDKGLQCMLDALQKGKNISASERCSAMNRMADIYIQHKKNPAAAVEILSRIIAEYPNSKYARYARERIAGIQE